MPGAAAPTCLSWPVTALSRWAERPRVVALFASALLAVASCGGSHPPLDQRQVAVQKAHLAAAALQRGQPLAAARAYDPALREARGVDDRPLVRRLLIDQAAALERGGRCDLAAPRLTEALALAATGAEPDSEAQGDRVRALLLRATCLATQDRAAATAALADAERALGSGASACARASLRCGQGALHAADGALDAAAGSYREASAAGCTDDPVVAQCAYNDGRLATRRGQHAAALASQRKAIAAASRCGDSAALADALLAASGAAEALGQGLEAAGLARRAGHAAWGAGRVATAAAAFATAARLYEAAGDRQSAERCRDDGRIALQRAEGAEAPDAEN